MMVKTTINGDECLTGNLICFEVCSRQRCHNTKLCKINVKVVVLRIQETHEIENIFLNYRSHSMPSQNLQIQILK